MSQELPLGSKERPLRVAVVGSGPSGFYAAEALLNAANFTAEVDMFDRLPTPYGLVRGGVAPDHQKIKSVIMVYEKIASKPGFRFFGNVHLGKNISNEDLKRHYDAIVYAVGNESDKKLGVPGEDLGGSHSATEFVGWYNGHPDHRNNQFDLNVERVAVVGIGNVAMDVTRVLIKEPDLLAKTDIASYAVEALRKSKVKEVILLGRRGPAQAAFSPKEIEELGELENSDLVVKPEEAELDEASKSQTLEPNDLKNVEYVQAHAKRGEGGKSRKIRLRFLASPVEVIGKDGKVAAIKIEKNKLVKDEKGGIKAKGTGEFETLPVGMVLRSVGYYGIAIPGVPFDERNGKIPNDAGRVLESAGGAKREGAYVVGWAKRGPSGLIGTNRADSIATVNALLEDFKGKSAPVSPEKTQEAALKTIQQKTHKLVTFQDWKALDKMEVERGSKAGKIREKFTDIKEMLSVLCSKASAV